MDCRSELGRREHHGHVLAQLRGRRLLEKPAWTEGTTSGCAASPGRQEGGWIELGTAGLPSAGRVNANVLRIPTRTFLPFIAAATADKRLAFRGF